MAAFDLGEGLRKVFLAGVGALATTYEKGSEIVDDLVKKGELTVEQGKALNTELKHSIKEAADKAAATPVTEQPAAAEQSASDAADAEPDTDEDQPKA